MPKCFRDLDDKIAFVAKRNSFKLTSYNLHDENWKIHFVGTSLM